MKPAASALVLAGLLLAALRPAAQEQAPAQPPPEPEPAQRSQPAPARETRRILLCFDLASGANFSREEELLLYESLLVQLGSASGKLAVVESPNRTPGASDLDRTTLARSLGADAWLRVSLSGVWTAAVFKDSSYDLLAL